jgi:hypothetical protein
LAALWQVQRQGEQGLGSQVQRVEEGGASLYVLRPTPETRIIIKRTAPTRASVVEIVRTNTLMMFRER